MFTHVAAAAPGQLTAIDTHWVWQDHHQQSIAEYVMAAAVMLRRNLFEQDRALRTGRWTSSVYDRSIPQPGSLHGARVGSAAIDVWYTYPDAGGSGSPAELPFHTLPNLLMTPHVSGVTACRAERAPTRSQPAQ